MLYLAVPINRLISQERSNVLSNANNSNTAQLWSLLKTTKNWGNKNKFINDLDPYDINDYFASVTTDTAYNRADVLQACKTRQHPLTHVGRSDHTARMPLRCY